MFRVASDTEMSIELLTKYINKHKALVASRYTPLRNAYENKYDILKAANKPDWKPDNRICVNFAKYITDTMNGFFMGIPVKTHSSDEAVAAYLEFLDGYNDIDNNNSELSKICDIYGHGYEMYYVDDDANIGITHITPMESFMIYDDSIIARPLFFVRYYKDEENVEHGSYSDFRIVQHFKREGSYKWDGEEHIHGFNGVPASEYVDNDERLGIFESAMPMINAYNKAISEKANDVDYFADAYLKIIGSRLEEDDLQNIRRNRIINFDGAFDGGIDVDFLQKPNGDTTQENLIDRLERLIYQMSMVANISDESFGAASGIALQYKLLSMQNLAAVKERKFTSGMNRRYKLIFSNPLSGMKADDWVGLKYIFSRNIPANISDEASTAAQLEGIVSKETQLGVLSIVDNVQEEINKLQDEVNAREADAVTASMFE